MRFKVNEQELIDVLVNIGEKTGSRKRWYDESYIVLDDNFKVTGFVSKYSDPIDSWIIDISFKDVKNKIK